MPLRQSISPPAAPAAELVILTRYSTPWRECTLHADPADSTASTPAEPGHLTPIALRCLLLLVDGTGAFCAVVAAEWLRDNVTLTAPLNALALRLDLLGFVLGALGWSGLLLLSRAYGTETWRGLLHESRECLRFSAVASLLAAGALYLTVRDVPRLQYFYFIVIAVAWQLMGRGWLAGLARVGALRLPAARIAIIGTGPIAEQAAQTFVDGRAAAEFIGFIGEPSSAGTALGSIDHIGQLIGQHRITHLVVPSRESLADLAPAIEQLRGLPVAILSQPGPTDLAFKQVQVGLLGQAPVLSLKPSGPSEWQRIVKRATDITLVVVSLPIVLPAIAIIGAAIKLDSPGPVLFRQWRVAEGGRVFTLYKFRSMFVGVRQSAPGEIKQRVDPRVTRAGRFIRAASLDELPQLWNVLKGDMSLVGPRPDVPELVAHYEGWQYQRLAVPQGLTGWWQVNGRATRPMQQHIEDDLYYVQHYSLWLDLAILARTVLAVVSRRGAY